MIISFLGINCTGKTTLSQQFAREFKGEYVSYKVEENIIPSFYVNDIETVYCAEKTYQKRINEICKTVLKKSNKKIYFFDRHPIEQLLYCFDRVYSNRQFDNLYYYLIKHICKISPTLSIILVPSDISKIVQRIKRCRSNMYRTFLTANRLQKLNKLYLLLYGILKGIGQQTICLDPVLPYKKVYRLSKEKILEIISKENDL